MLGSEDEPNNGFDDTWREVSSVADSHEDIGVEEADDVRNVNIEDLESFAETLEIEDYFPTPSKMEVEGISASPFPSVKSYLSASGGEKSPEKSPRAVENLPKFMIWKGVWKFISFLSFSVLLLMLICLDSYSNGTVHSCLAYFMEPTPSSTTLSPHLLNSSQSFSSPVYNNGSWTALSDLCVNNSNNVSATAYDTDSFTVHQHSFWKSQVNPDVNEVDVEKNPHNSGFQEDGEVVRQDKASSDSLSSPSPFISNVSSMVFQSVDAVGNSPALGGWLFLFLWICFICSILIVLFIQRNKNSRLLREDENNSDETLPFEDVSLLHDSKENKQHRKSRSTVRVDPCPESPVSEHGFTGIMHSMSGDETSHSDETTDGPPIAKALYQFSSDYTFRNHRYDLRSSGRKSNNPYYLRSDDETSVFSDITHDAAVRKAGRHNPSSRQGRKY
jgi:hypothetical protein